MADLLRQGGIALVLAFVCYTGAYYALVEPDPFYPIRYEWKCFWFGEPVEYQAPPKYSYGGEAAERFFFPVHCVDRWLRPRVWSKS